MRATNYLLLTTYYLLLTTYYLLLTTYYLLLTTYSLPPTTYNTYVVDESHRLDTIEGAATVPVARRVHVG